MGLILQLYATLYPILYAKPYEPYFAPMERINYNNLKASIGDNFLDWADEYFTPDRLNIEVARREMQDDYKASCGNFKLTAQGFRNKLGQYCQLKGYTLSDVIKKTEYTLDNRRTSVDYFIIKTETDTQKPEETTPAAPKTNNLAGIEDDIPF